MKRLASLVLAAFLSVPTALPLATVTATAVVVTSCAKAPVALTPQATVAWYGTRVIANLDLLRDTVISANSLTPPLISTDSARKVVLYHRSALLIIHEAPEGWRNTVQTSLDELVKKLPSNERDIVNPYVQLVKTLLQEIR